MTLRGVRRVIVGLTGVALLVGIAVVPPPASTEAAWVDLERATATVTAYNVPEPVGSRTTSCTLEPGVLGLSPKVTVYWRVPSGVTGYTIANAEFATLTTGLLPSLLDPLLGASSTTGGPTEYTTVLSGAVLSGLLGGEKKIGIRFVYPGTLTPAPVPDTRWRSDWLVAHSSMGLAGINPTCTVTTQASY